MLIYHYYAEQGRCRLSCAPAARLQAAAARPLSMLQACSTLLNHGSSKQTQTIPATPALPCTGSALQKCYKHRGHPCPLAPRFAFPVLMAPVECGRGSVRVAFCAARACIHARRLSLHEVAASLSMQQGAKHCGYDKGGACALMPSECAPVVAGCGQAAAEAPGRKRTSMRPCCRASCLASSTPLCVWAATCSIP